MTNEQGKSTEPQWLHWAKRLQAIAQNGLAYADSPFDVERYHAIRAVAVEMMAAHSQAAASDLAASFGAEIGYATPKLDVRAAIFRNGKILLVRERSDGRWTLPGGWVDVGDTPSRAIEREVREEAGYPARAVKLLALWDRDQHGHPPLSVHVYKLVFLCELLADRPAADFQSQNMETVGVSFFARDAIPPLSHTRTMPDQIQRLFDLAADPHTPTVYD